MYINEYKQTNQTVTTDQAGETYVDACSPTHIGDTMEVLPEAHGRSSEQHEPPENLRKETMENDRGEAFVPVRQHFVLANARFLSLTVSLSFIVQGGRPFTSY